MANDKIISASEEYATINGWGAGISDAFYDGAVWRDSHADDDTTDGFHTIGELYEYRKLYNAAFANMLALTNMCRVVKSTRHSDGKPCFDGGWFIVVIELPTGQISNHYEMKDWHLFQCEEADTAPTWDGHTPQLASKRLEEFCKLSVKIKQ